MQSTPMLRRWLAFAGSFAVLGLVLGILVVRRNAPNKVQAEDDKPAAKDGRREWTMWGGTIQRNLVNTVEKDIATDWAVLEGKEKNLLWAENLGSKAYGGPIVAGGRIYVGTNNNRPRDKEVRGDKGILLCFEEATGKFLWQIVHDKLAAGRVNDWPEEGICSSPVVEGNRLWYVSNRCEVVCAGTDGKILWTLDMIKDLGVFPHNLAVCSPIIVGDLLFIITANGVDEEHINIPAPNAPSFLTVDKNKGKVLWSSKLPGRNIMHGQWSNPVYTVVNGKPQVIFPGGDGWIYSFNPADGELLWKFDCNPKGAVYRLRGKGTKNDFVSTPVIHDNKLYIGVGQDPEHLKGNGWLWCIDITKQPKNKDKDVSPFTPEKVEIPDKIDPKDARNKDSALVWCYGGKNPDEEGIPYLFGRTMSTCAIHDGLCFAADFDGRLLCLDARTGQRHWEHDMEAETWSSPYVVDGKVHLANERGQVLIFEAASKMKLVSKVQMLRPGGKIRATPVAVNGVLYVLTENPCKLWAIKAK